MLTERSGRGDGGRSFGRGCVCGAIGCGVLKTAVLGCLRMPEKKTTQTAQDSRFQYPAPTAITAMSHGVETGNLRNTSTKNNEPADKPGYVVNDHLSRPAVTSRLKRPTLKHDGPPYRLMCGLASDGVYMAWPVTRPTVVSYTAFPPLPVRTGTNVRCRPRNFRSKTGGISLLHFPWSHLHRTLSGILPCEARTFLTCTLSVMQPRSFSRLVIVRRPAGNPRRNHRPPAARHLFYHNLYLKATISNKFTKDRVFRNILAADAQKIVQKLQQPLGFIVFRLPLFYGK